MTWTALLPIKAPGCRKSRLAPMLTAAQRDTLAEKMLGHVIEVLSGIRQVSRVVIVSPVRPCREDVEWFNDGNDDLNASLSAARAFVGSKPLLVILPDLPFLLREEVEHLLMIAADSGVAFAQDLHGIGTNAIATKLSDEKEFCFGRSSLKRFMIEWSVESTQILNCLGLARDIDDVGDYEIYKRTYPLSDYAAIH